MLNFLNLKNNLNIILENLLVFFLLLFPWPTVYLLKEKYVHGSKMEYTTLNFYATEIILWLIFFVFIFWFISNFKEKRLKLMSITPSRDRVLVFFSLILLIYGFLSCFWSLDPQIAYQNTLRIMEGTLLFYVIVIAQLNRHKLALAYLIGSIIPSLLGIWQFIIQDSFNNKWLGLVNHPVWLEGTSIVSGDSIGRWFRAYGSFAHPNLFGGYLAFGIVLLSYLLVFKKNNLKQKILLFVILALNSTALFFTFSRSAWISVSAALAGLFIHYFNNRNKIDKKDKNNFGYLLIFPIVFLIFLVIYFPLVKNRTSIISINETRSVQERLSGNREAISIIKYNFLQGVGAGNYTLKLEQNNPMLPGYSLQPVHNVFLLFFAEYGLIGVVILVAMIFSFCIFFYGKKILFKKNLPILFFALSLFFLASVDHYFLSSYQGIIIFFYIFSFHSPSTNNPLV